MSDEQQTYRELKFPKETVQKLKEMFPYDKELAKALDANHGSAWDLVRDKVKALGDCWLAIGMAGFPGITDNQPLE